VNRTRMRLEARAARALSAIIHEMKDPRLPLVVTVERVRLSPDLSRGRVLISALERTEETVAILNHAHGYLQESLAREVGLRRIPRLSFHADPGEVL